MRKKKKRRIPKKKSFRKVRRKKTRKRKAKKVSKKPQEAYGGDVQKGVQKLIDIGKEKGHLTYDEINDVLPENVVTSEQIDDIFMKLSSENIKVVDNEEDVAKEEGAEEKPGAEQLIRMPQMEDPVRMYLRQMGQISLLTREEEIGLAKEIEVTEEMYFQVWGVVTNVIHAVK